MTDDSARIDFVCIGAQKCATTWLHDVIATHPQVAMPHAVKEVDFFSAKFDRGYQWYERHFAPDTAARLRGEVSPSYLCSADAPARVKAYNPAMKIVLIARDPIARAISNHKHEVRIGHLVGDDLRFEKGLANNPMYVEQGLYATHLERWLEFFPGNQVLVLKFETLKAEPLSTLAEVCDFLGVSAYDGGSVLTARPNPSYLPKFRALESGKNAVRDALRSAGLAGLWTALGNSGLRGWYQGKNRIDPSERIGKPRPETLEELKARFGEDARKFSALTGINVDDWLDSVDGYV
jgi:hypothetical protein